MAMTSVRLCGTDVSSTGYQDKCYCQLLERHHGPMIKTIQKMLKKVSKSAGFRSQKTQVKAGLLQDWAVITLNRSREVGTIHETLPIVLEILVTLMRCDIDEEDYDPYDGTDRPNGPLDPGVAANGLGEAGCVPVPPNIWEKHAPTSLEWALRQIPDQRCTWDPGLAAMAERMCADGLLNRDLQGGPSNLKAFAKPKNATKGALIADLRALKSLLPKPLPFALPSLSELGDLFTACKHLGQPIYFAKIDISNMYWACKLPANLRDSIRFRVNGRSYHIPSLPFGWAFSPILAIETLSRSLVLQYPGTIILTQYLDDVLLISTNPLCLRLEANQLATDLSKAGWKVSPKSDLEPKTSVTWLGKTIDGATFSMAQAPTYLAQVIKGWVKLACRTYTEKRARRLVGKILWAATPSRQPLPFLQGPMAWTTWGPPCAPFTPPRVLRSLCHAISLCCQPWHAKRCVDPQHTWYVDAARSDAGYVAAVWGPDLGCRIKLLPDRIFSQQSAELMAIEMAAKWAVQMKLPAIHVGADNLGAIWSAIRLSGSVGHPGRGRLLRRLAHTLRWGNLHLKLSWVVSKQNPADYPSRVFEFDSPTLMHASAWATLIVATRQSTPHLLHMGWAGCGTARLSNRAYRCPIASCWDCSNARSSSGDIWLVSSANASAPEPEAP